MTMNNDSNSNGNGCPVNDIIRIEHLHKSFHHGRVVALDDVSLCVPQGQVTVIIGPSGSGKSTLLRCINYLEVPDSGLVMVDGIPLAESENINRVRAEVGMVFQQFNLFPHLSVLDNLMLAQKVVRKRNRDEAEAIARDLLVKVGIPEKAESFPLQLSGGQQRGWPLRGRWPCSPRSCSSASLRRLWTRR